MHTRVNDLTRGIAIDSFVDKGMLFYCVHLENGAFVSINLGFLSLLHILT